MLISCLVLITGLSVSGQPADRNGYLQKSKSQRTAAFVILGVGYAVDIIALATFPKDYGVLNTPEQNRQAKNAAWIFVAGTVTMLASIPFFVNAHANKKKALRMSVKVEDLPPFKKYTPYNSSYPALALKLNL